MSPDDLSHLPFAHAAALRMRALHLPDEVIAQVLDVDPTSVPALLEVAEAKLARVREAAVDATGERIGES